MTNYSNEELEKVMQERNLSRKSAVQYLRRQRSKVVVVDMAAAEQRVLASVTPTKVQNLLVADSTVQSNAHKAMEELETLPPAQTLGAAPAAPAAAKEAAAQAKAAAKAAKAQAKADAKAAQAQAKASKLDAKAAKATAKNQAKAEAKVARDAARAAKLAAKAEAKANTARKPRNSNFDTDKAIELYKAGTKVVDIAVALGYAKGQGQNRTRAALKAAGVYVERTKSAGETTAAAPAAQ